MIVFSFYGMINNQISSHTLLTNSLIMGFNGDSPYFVTANFWMCCGLFYSQKRMNWCRALTPILSNYLIHSFLFNFRSHIVKSQSSNGDYNVSSTDLGLVCSCPDHTYRGVKCKHIFTVEISFALHKEVEVARIEPVDIDCCIYCKSPWIVKNGLRHNKYGNIQEFNCRDCHKYFTINLGFERIHGTPEIVTSAMQLYFTGESLRNVQKFLKLQSV
jgi:transposase-like protein